MPLYVGKAGDHQGRLHAFALEAADRRTLDAQLREMGQFPIQVEEMSRGLLTRAYWSNIFEGVISTTTLIGFTHALAVLLRSGIPLVEAILMATSREEDPDAREVFTALARSIERGQSFHESLSRYPAVFSSNYVHAVMAGEKAGMLARVLFDLARDLERMRELRTRLLLSMAYPLFLTAVAFLVVGMTIFYVMPRLAALNEGLGAEMPGMAGFVMDARSWLYDNGLLVLICIGFGIYEATRALSSEAGRRWLDHRIKRLPLIGQSVDTYRTVLLFRSLSLLREAGIPLIDGLATLEGGIKSSSYRESIGRARRYLEYGNSVVVAFEGARLLNPECLRIIQAGEESGTLETALREVADTMERNLGSLIDRLTGVLPAILLVVSALVIAFVLLSLLVPMTQTIGNI